MNVHFSSLFYSIVPNYFLNMAGGSYPLIIVETVEFNLVYMDIDIEN